MDMMDDDRHFGAMSRNPAHDARLPAARVCTISGRRSRNSEVLHRLICGLPIQQSALTWPDEPWHSTRQNIWMRDEAMLLSNFLRPCSGPEIISTLRSGSALQTKNRGDCIFLRAADNQPCDDVCDPHWPGVKG